MLTWPPISARFVLRVSLLRAPLPARCARSFAAAVLLRPASCQVLRMRSILLGDFSVRSLQRMDLNGDGEVTMYEFLRYSFVEMKVRARVATTLATMQFFFFFFSSQSTTLLAFQPRRQGG